MAAILRTFAVRAMLGAGLALAAASPVLAQFGASGDDAAPSPVPNGNGCAGVIARWQEFSGRESQGGHMDEAVYNQIQNDIDRASCPASQRWDAQARRLVTDSKRKHGY